MLRKDFGSQNVDDETSEKERMRSAASMDAITHAGGFNLSCSVYFLNAFHLSFLPAVPLHVWLSIPETPAVLPHSRSRRGCQGGCTGQWIRWRAVECQNCSRVSFCGPSFLFPLRFNMKFSKCRCANGMWRLAWLLPW